MSCKQSLVRFYSVPGAFPRPDDQGYSLFCSRFALAKAICNGFMVVPTKFHDFDIDFTQGEIAAVLINKHKVKEITRKRTKSTDFFHSRIARESGQQTSMIHTIYRTNQQRSGGMSSLKWRR